MDFFEPSSFAIPNFHNAVLKSCSQHHKHFRPKQNNINEKNLTSYV
jgi:hypothetical protein